MRLIDRIKLIPIFRIYLNQIGFKFKLKSRLYNENFLNNGAIN